MRVKVNSQRVAEAKKKAKGENSWKSKKSISVSKNGRVQLKDLQGKSYMAMGFYKKFPMPSVDFRIIDL